MKQLLFFSQILFLLIAVAPTALADANPPAIFTSEGYVDVEAVLSDQPPLSGSPWMQGAPGGCGFYALGKQGEQPHKDGFCGGPDGELTQSCFEGTPSREAYCGGGCPPGMRCVLRAAFRRRSMTATDTPTCTCMSVPLFITEKVRAQFHLDEAPLHATPSCGNTRRGPGQTGIQCGGECPPGNVCTRNFGRGASCQCVDEGTGEPMPVNDLTYDALEEH